MAKNEELMKISGLDDASDESSVEEYTVPVAEFYSIPKEAEEMKRYLVQLAQACEQKIGDGSKESIKTIGADLIRIITTRFGDRTNFEAIAAVTNVLLYILDESEKRSMQAVSLMRNLPAPKSIQ